MLLNHIKRELQNLKSPLYRNSIYISLASLTTAVAGFLFWAIAARLYPAEDVGVASAIVSALNLTFQLSMLGMNFAIIRFYPEYKERAIGSALLITSVAGVIFSVAYGLIMLGSESFKELGWKFLGLFVLFSVIGTLYNMLSTYAIARRKAEHAFLQSLLFAGRFLFLFLLVSMGALGIVSSFGLGLLLGLGYAVLMVGLPKVELDREFIGEAFHFFLGNYLASMANMAPNYLMPTLVLSMLGKEEAAYFYMAFAVGNLILFVPNAINTSFFVEGSHGLKNMGQTLKKAIAFSYAYLAVAVVGVWLFGGFVLRFFGEGYVKGLDLLKLIMIGGFFVIPLRFIVTTMNINKRIDVVAMLNILRAVLFLGLSYLWVPILGIEGIGWGWICSYFFVVIVSVFIISTKRIELH